MEDFRYGDQRIPEGFFAIKAFPLPNQSVGLAFENTTSRKEAEESLRQLRRQLIGISVCTFLATTLGGSLLVGLGLAPLKRLSDAVSRVSPRDFKLPLANPAALGREDARPANKARELLRESAAALAVSWRP